MEEASRCRAGVNGIGELNFLLVQLSDQIEQILHTAAESIKLPDNEGVTFSQGSCALVRPGRSARLPVILSSNIFQQPAFVRASICSSRF